MIEYVATFFTHYDAVLFAQSLLEQGINAKCCPTPRELSSSCGTAVRFAGDINNLEQWFVPSVEQICSKNTKKWEIIFDNR